MEDYHIEGMLDTAFELKQLIKQEAKTPIDFTVLNNYWSKKTKPKLEIKEE